MRYRTSFLIAGAVCIPLMTAGCIGSSGPSFLSILFAGLFGGNSGNDSSELLQFAFNGFGGGSDGANYSDSWPESEGQGTPISEGIASDAPSVATLHNPEPASLALFGAGLLGLVFARRRRSRLHSF